MATNKSSEASRNGVGFGRAAAMVAACGLILGVSGTSSSAPTIAGLQLSSGNLQNSSGVTVPASAALSFRPPVTIMADGVTGAGLVPGLGGLPGLPGSPGSPGLPGSPGFSGLASGSSVPGSNLFVQPGPASARGSLAAVVPYAHQGLGHPYVWGGTSFTSGWDCSGFVQWAFAQAGFQMPRVSQWEGMQPTQNPSPGDLVTQRPDGPNHWAHVGIYIGDGMMISALNPDQGTIIHSIGPAGTSWFFTLPGTARSGADPSDLPGSGITAPGSGITATVPGLSFPSVSGTSGGSSGGSSVNASNQRNDGPSKSRKGSDSKRDRTPNTFENDSISVPGAGKPTSSPTDKPKSHNPSRPSGQGNVDKPSTTRPDRPKQSHDQKPDKNPGTGTSTGTKPGTGTNTGTKPTPTPGTGTTNPKPKPGTGTGTVTPPATNKPDPKPVVTVPPVQTPPPATTPPANQTPPPAPKPDPEPTVEQPTSAPVTDPPTTPSAPTTPATPAGLTDVQIGTLLAEGAAALAAGGPAALGTVVTADPQIGDLVFYPGDAANPAHVAVYLGGDKVHRSGDPVGGSLLGGGGTFYRAG